MDYETAVRIVACWSPANYKGCIRVDQYREGILEHQIWTGDVCGGWGNLAAAISAEKLEEATKLVMEQAYKEKAA